MAREQAIDIHNFAHQYDLVHGVVQRSTLSERNKTLIFAYRDVCLRQALCGQVRMIRVMGALTVFGRLLNKDFDTVTKADIEGLVSQLLRRRPQYSPETIGTYKAIMKKFFAWVLQPDDFPSKTPPAAVAWITCHVREKDRRPLQAKDFLTPEEAARLLSVCENARDKALVSTLWESGGRIAEVGNRQLKDLTKVQYGYLLDVNGKTGARTPLLVSSAPYLSAWLAYHPFADDPNAPLWVLQHPQGEHRYMRYPTIRKLLITLFARAGIKKRPNPHGLRHARTTNLASGNLMNEPQLKAYLGWSQNSTMLSRYAHLNTADANNAILAENGLAPRTPQPSPLTVRTCTICQEPNPPTASLCVRCSNPLDPKTAHALHAQQEHTTKLVLDMAKALVEKGLLDEAAATIHAAGWGRQLKALANTPPG